MRQLVFFVLFLASCPWVFSQSLGPRLLGAAGAKGETQGISLSWSMGEPVIGTASSGPNALTQGFQQPELMESQVIPLPQHWCYFSSYIDQDGQNIAMVTAEILPHVRLIKNEDGEVYIPGFGVNQIGAFRMSEAYQSNLTLADTLVLRGFSVLPEQTSINLNAGWNLLSYLRREAAPVADLMQSLGNQLFLLKTYSGNIYWPAFSFNNVYNLQPGRGYSVRMNSAAIYYYPANQQVFAKNLGTESTFRHFSQSNLSGENMTLAIPLDAWNEVPRKGDEVGVFNQDGDLVTSQVFDGGNMAFSLWGRDEFTSSGLEDLQAFVLKFWDASQSQEDEFLVESWIEGDGLYHSRSLSIVGKLRRLEGGSDLQISPNPARDFLNLSFTPQGDQGEIQIFDASGKRMWQQSFTGIAGQALNNMLALPKMAPGHYWLRVLSGNRKEEASFTIIP